MVEIITIEPFDSLKASNEASTDLTVPIISVWKFAAQPSSLGLPPPALTCGTRISKPPKSPIAEAIHVFNASPSATSTAPPIALTPLPFNASKAEFTSSIFREQIATSTPSSANA